MRNCNETFFDVNLVIDDKNERIGEAGEKKLMRGADDLPMAETVDEGHVRQLAESPDGYFARWDKAGWIPVQAAVCRSAVGCVQRNELGRKFKPAVPPLSHKPA